MNIQKQSERRTHLVRLIVITEGDDSPGTSRVVLVACNARQPHGHCLGRYFVGVNPSSVTRPSVHPHGMVTVLKRLDASTEEYFQQVHASDTLIDQLDHPLN